MKPTDFAYYLTCYLGKYLPGVIGAGSNTIKSYRDTFSLLLKFCSLEKSIPAEKLSLDRIDRTMIEEFLAWLENERNCSVATRNQRLAAIKSFYKYLQFERPHTLYQLQDVLAIPVKKMARRSIQYLSPDAVKKLLDMPNKATKRGRRDLVLLSLLYDSGARVQELADVRVADVRLASPATIILTGKGNKTRIVPLMAPMAVLIEQYISDNKLNLVHCNEYPLFQNSSGNKLSRSGIAYILKKYCSEARKHFPECFTEAISPHVMRHTKSMHLLQSGVELIFIRDLLGHVSIQTTEVYARADSSMKRKALESAYVNTLSEELPEWQQNADLLEWLQNLGK